MHNVQPINLVDPVTPEMNLYLFFKQVADEVTPLSIQVLEFLVSSGTSRGWFPNISQLTERFLDDHSAETINDTLSELVRQRLLYLDPEQPERVVSIVGGISQTKTLFRAMTNSNVAFYLLGALDAFTVAPMLQKEVSIRTTCGQTGETIELIVDSEGTWTGCNPTTVAAFLVGWDGAEPIPTVMNRSRLFLNSTALNDWQSANEDPVGLPLTQDTIRGVGMEMALALSELYTKMSIS